MSNIFNDFYVNVADGITRTIPLTPKSPLDYLSDRTCNSLFLTLVTEIEVNDLINILNPSKSVGPNSIPMKLLKIIGYSVSPHLALLVNQSFQSGVFPDKLKIAKIISIFKKGNPELPSNYRPISLLPIFSKIFEKLMYKLSDFWTFFGTSEPTQSRFMFVNCAQRLLSCCCSVYIFSRMVAIRIQSTKTDILNSLSKDILNSLDR